MHSRRFTAGHADVVLSFTDTLVARAGSVPRNDVGPQLHEGWPHLRGTEMVRVATGVCTHTHTLHQLYYK